MNVCSTNGYAETLTSGRPLLSDREISLNKGWCILNVLCLKSLSKGDMDYGKLINLLTCLKHLHMCFMQTRTERCTDETLV